MKFVKITDTEQVVEYIAYAIQERLDEGKRVLWLVPGGSAIAIAVAVSRQIQGNRDLLSVTLTDERFGPVDHDDSNWRQLIDAGVDFNGIDTHAVLSGANRAETTKRFASTLDTLFAEADYRIGFFGMGPDGHIAGVLPGSVAVDAEGSATDYDANFERISMTLSQIAKLDEAIVYAVGEAKQEALDNLVQDLPLDVQPAQILKQVPNVIIFNDYKTTEEI